MFIIAYTFKGQVHDIVFAGREKIADAISSGGGGGGGGGTPVIVLDPICALSVLIIICSGWI